MTSPIVLDFETFFDPKTQVLARNMSIEQYVLDRRFQVHGCTVIEREHPRVPRPAATSCSYLGTVDWSKQAVLSHNARFDMAILAWRFGIIPGGIIDTLSIANVFIKPHTGKVSLEECCKYLGIAGKDHDVLEAVRGADHRADQARARPVAGAGHLCRGRRRQGAGDLRRVLGQDRCPRARDHGLEHP